MLQIYVDKRCDVNDCLNYNLHTLVVKPFTTKTKDAKKLITKKKEKKFMVWLSSIKDLINTT